MHTGAPDEVWRRFSGRGVVKIVEIHDVLQLQRGRDQQPSIEVEFVAIGSESLWPFRGVPFTLEVPC